jgi:hypothetical protein
MESLISYAVEKKKKRKGEKTPCPLMKVLQMH